MGASLFRSASTVRVGRSGRAARASDIAGGHTIEWANHITGAIGRVSTR